MRGEAEIEAFRALEYWSVDTLFQNNKGESFTARITHLDSEKLNKMSLASEAIAIGPLPVFAKRTGRYLILKQNACAAALPALYDLYLAAGSLAQAGLFGQPYNADCPKAI